MFGFLAARCLALGVAAMIHSRRRSARDCTAAPSADLPNGQMVERFDSYLYRARPALPAPAQAEIDAISAILPSLKETLDRVDTLDPARRTLGA